MALWLPEAWYNKGRIRRFAKSHKGRTSIMISMSVYLSVCDCEDISETTRAIFTIFGAYCLRSRLDLVPAKGAKSVIYDCLVLSKALHTELRGSKPI